MPADGRRDTSVVRVGPSEVSRSADPGIVSSGLEVVLVPRNPEAAVLLFFTTARSGPARRMESVLAQLARKERDRLRVVAVDADRSPELAECFAVGEIPTLVLLRARRPVARLEGRASGAEIAAMIEPHLAVESGVRAA
jgi:thioredoxin-like negative regulator of GroEL